MLNSGTGLFLSALRIGTGLDLLNCACLGSQGVLDSFNTTLSFTPTPLPAALPLFATGLGALGLLGWRRKRKALLSQPDQNT